MKKVADLTIDLIKGPSDCHLRRSPAPAEDESRRDLQAVLNGCGNAIIELVEGGNAFRPLLS
jgi:hypothetical protein